MNANRSGSRALALVLLAAIGSALLYLIGFALAFPLLTNYNTPLLDLGKLTNRAPAGAIQFFIPVALLFVLYALVCRAASAAIARARWVRWLLVFAPIVFIAALLFTFPLGAIDLYDYTFQTKLFAQYGVSPLVHTASEYSSDPLYGFVAWANVPSPYGPLWQGLAVFAYQLVSGNLLRILFAFKLMAAAALLANAALAYLIVRRWRPVDAWAAFCFVAWNPLLLFETAANGHNDALMMTFVLIGLGLFQSRRLSWAMVALLLAALIKLPALAALPVVGLAALRLLPTWRARLSWLLRTLLVSAFLLLLLYAPLASDGLFGKIAAHQSLFTSSPAAVAYLILRLAGTEGEARWLVQVVALSALCLGVLWRLWRSDPSLKSVADSTFDVFLLLLLCATFWFQPWYLLWIVPLAALASARRRAFAALFSLTIFAIYFVFDFWIWWNVEFFFQNGGLPMNLAVVALAFGPPLFLFAWPYLRRAENALRRRPLAARLRARGNN